MNTYQAYQYEVSRLTQDQKTQLNVHEGRIGRQLACWEIVKVFNLEPSEKITPRKRRLSDEVDSHWSEQNGF